MPAFPPITVRQPQPFDIVDDPVEICGVGSGFEGVFSARIRDSRGVELSQVNITAGGTGILANYRALLPLGRVPATPQGTLEVFEFSSGGDDAELNKVVVSIVFGRALINPYRGFAQYTIVPGDTLSGIAQRFYGDGALFARIFEANRDQVSNPNMIFPGQVLRIPQS